jgi:uncharacterized Rmd1/YagE family protein
MNENIISHGIDPVLQGGAAGGGPVVYALQADLFTGPIDLRGFRTRHPDYPVLCPEPLVLELELGRYAFLSRFGVMVCWNCPEALVRSLRQDLQALPGVGGLALFDAPAETWEDEALDRLHHALHRQLDLKERLEALHRKLACLNEAAGTVMGVLSNRTSHRMEWIIIILITIETVSFLWKEFLFR